MVRILLGFELWDWFLTVDNPVRHIKQCPFDFSYGLFPTRHQRGSKSSELTAEKTRMSTLVGKSNAYRKVTPISLTTGGLNHTVTIKLGISTQLRGLGG